MGFLRAPRKKSNTSLANSPAEQQCTVELLQLAESEGIRDRFVLFNDEMSKDAVYELTNACDVYCSLHRAEGFGLGNVEVMSFSKPVVATDFSATKEFCLSEHCILVPCQMSEVSPSEMADMPSYRWCRTWADPDIHAAARVLRRLYDDAALREQLGCKARHFIEYTIENFRSSVKLFLSLLPSPFIKRTCRGEGKHCRLANVQNNLVLLHGSSMEETFFRFV